MTINEFIDHIKHKSMKVIIIDANDKLIYNGTLGTFINSVARLKIGFVDIVFIQPTYNTFNIHIPSI